MSWTPPNPETVQKIFRSISRSYDLANRVLSLGLDQSWRRAAVKEALFAAPGAKSVVDLATGTGDLAIAFRERVGASARVVGADFSSEMLVIAKKKDPSIDWHHADALHLPFENESFDIATISFGLRNVQDPDRALAELFRIIRPGGAVVILEFGSPGRSLAGRVVNLINRLWLRLMGGALTGEGWAYQYLSKTSEAFPGAEQLQARASTLLPNSAVSSRLLFPGICYLCTIRKVSD